MSSFDDPSSSFEARVYLVDAVNAALTAHQTVSAMATFKGTQGIFDFHRSDQSVVRKTRMARTKTHPSKGAEILSG